MASYRPHHLLSGQVPGWKALFWHRLNGLTFPLLFPSKDSGLSPCSHASLGFPLGWTQGVPTPPPDDFFQDRKALS